MKSATFDKVYTVNSLHFWADKAQALKEVQRVLKPGGMISVFDQPYRGDPNEVGAQTLKFLTEAGFERIAMEQHAMEPTAIVCVQAFKAN